MGLILDSSVLIAGERRDESIREILLQLRSKHGETDTGISAVTIVELTHGIYRAKADLIASAAALSQKTFAETWSSTR